MKRILGILIAALAIIHIAGVTPFYIAVLQFIKQEVTVELSNANRLTKVAVSATELTDPTVFSRLEEGEFVYRGKLYDFKKEEHTGEGLIFYALEDEKESALQAALSFLYSNTAPGKTSSPLGKLLKDFSKDYLANGVDVMPTSTLTVNFEYTTTYTTTNLMKGHYNQLINPPDNRNTHA
ncbi:MAG: hypothetical protein U0T75_03600 [Chitinophagales bacterium]